MVGLIPLPDPDAKPGAAMLWINPSHVVTATAILDHAAQPPRLIVELKMQGLPLSRHVLATGTDDQLEAAWSNFASQLAGGEQRSPISNG